MSACINNILIIIKTKLNSRKSKSPKAKHKSVMSATQHKPETVLKKYIFLNLSENILKSEVNIQTCFLVKSLS